MEFTVHVNEHLHAWLLNLLNTVLSDL